MKRLKELIFVFLMMMKIGAFTFGGGYAMIALLENELVSKRGWIERDEFLDLAAIAESTPGPIAINVATYVGYKRMGFFGALFATVGMCLPSFAVIFLISLFFDAFLSLEVVGYAFRGIRIGVIYIIFSAGIRMLKGIKKNALNLSVICAVTVLMTVLSLLALRLSTIIYILACGFLGVTLYLVRRALGKEDEV
jgi:chromate transporter